MLASKKGFTLIEMIFVLSITLIISTITLFFRKPHANVQTQITHVSQAFHLARSTAMIKHETVSVVCQRNRVDINSNHYHKEVILDSNYQFTNNYQFTFNASGHIKIARSVKLRTPFKVYEFVFQLGSGTFYVK